jgi:hypothetical protein
VRPMGGTFVPSSSRCAAEATARGSRWTDYRSHREIPFLEDARRVANEQKENTMKTTAQTPLRASRAKVFALAALLVALATTLANPAEATFPGENGRIALASNRTAGEGVDNPEGDFEIFTMNQDGTGLTQLTQNAAFDFDLHPRLAASVGAILGR